MARSGPRSSPSPSWLPCNSCAHASAWSPAVDSPPSSAAATPAGCSGPRAPCSSSPTSSTSAPISAEWAPPPKWSLASAHSGGPPPTHSSSFCFLPSPAIATWRAFSSGSRWCCSPTSSPPSSPSPIGLKCCASRSSPTFNGPALIFRCSSESSAPPSRRTFSSGRPLKKWKRSGAWAGPP